MNLDAIFTFVMAVLTASSALFVANPLVSTVLGHISQILALLGTAFHLDGK